MGLFPTLISLTVYVNMKHYRGPYPNMDIVYMRVQLYNIATCYLKLQVFMVDV